MDNEIWKLSTINFQLSYVFLWWAAKRNNWNSFAQLFVVFSADRLCDHDFNWNYGFDLFAFAKNESQAKDSVRNLANGLHLSNRSFGLADFDGGFSALALFAGRRIICPFWRMCYFLAGVSRARRFWHKRLDQMFYCSFVGKSGIVRNRWNIKLGFNPLVRIILRLWRNFRFYLQF